MRPTGRCCKATRSRHGILASPACLPRFRTRWIPWPAGCLYKATATIPRAFDARGLLPEQVQGYGLGVMRARALYCAQKTGIDATALCAFGPHGDGLVIANAPDQGYDDAVSRTLTAAAVTANLDVRALGFKPYIAPGLSSACVSPAAHAARRVARRRSAHGRRLFRLHRALFPQRPGTFTQIAVRSPVLPPYGKPYPLEGV